MITLYLYFSMTFEEHIFEIVLPRPCCVGHVDVKFTLHPQCTNAPDIQVTLLKQNISGIGRGTGHHGTVEVDKGINFSMPQGQQSQGATGCDIEMTDMSTENNVLDPQFQESHNAEILCGPIPLSSCLDLSGTCGLVTLTSPQLMLSKPKSFLLHIKGFIQNNVTFKVCDDKKPEKSTKVRI